MNARRPDVPSVPLDVAVRFAETDQMGVVHHSAYVVWFEMGRIAWMDAAGLPYFQIAAAGFNFAVTEIGCRYRAPIRFGEPVRVLTRLTALRSRQVAFDYEVRAGEDNGLRATGKSEHICVDAGGDVARIPTWVLAGLQTGASRLAEEMVTAEG